MNELGVTLQISTGPARAHGGRPSRPFVGGLTEAATGSRGYSGSHSVPVALCGAATGLDSGEPR